jgi:hypothetical protein
MKQLFNGSRIGIEGENRIYVQGNYLEWYNEYEDILEGQDLPLVFCNLDMIDIDQDGILLEQIGKETLLEDTTWYLYETDCTGVKENYIDAEILKQELCIEEDEIKEDEKIELDKKIYKNIAKCSSPEYYHKNIAFIKSLLKLQNEDRLDEVNFIEKEVYTDVPNYFNEELVRIYWYSLVEIDGNYMPVPILVSILFGKNYINWDTKKGMKRLFKIWDNMKHIFKHQDEEEHQEYKIQKWSEITAIEKVADFVATFMKTTGIESKNVVSDIMDNLHKDWKDDFDNIEFRNIEFVKSSDPKEFVSEIVLINDGMAHSWAGGTSNKDTATLLYGNKDNFKFGERYHYEYYDNGNQTCDENRLDEPDFKIDETYVVLIKNNDYSDYNNNHYDNTSYKCIAYVGDESCYNFEHEQIIKKYNIDIKVIRGNRHEK